MKDDYLRECMTDVGNVPLNEFNMVFCRVCARRECARSGLNSSAFDQRVDGWKEKLFTNVDRPEDDDPRYAGIRSKKFLPISSPSVEVKTFQSVPVITPEPRKAVIPDLEPPAAPDMPEPSNPAPDAPDAPDADSVPEPPILELPEPVPVQAPQRPMSPGTGNTPFSQGTVLPGGENEVVTEAGSTYLFEDD